MIVRTTVVIGLVALGMASCSEKSETVKKEKTEISEGENESEATLEAEKTEEKAPNIISFDPQSTFKISTKELGMNAGTGEPDLDIFVNHELFKSPIKITKDVAYSKVAAGTNGVPKSAVFAFSTWFAGGGAVYYGIVKDGILQINRKFEDEMTTGGLFTLYREIDPNVLTKTPSYYISYNSDDKKSKELMIAFTENGKGLFAKYYGQPRQIELRFKKDESQGRNIVELYDEIVNGEINGTYKLSHSGNYDYAEYTNKKSGKKYTFTINHDVTIMDDTYRTVPSL